MEAADQTFYLTKSQYNDTGPTSPSADPLMQGAWQGSHYSTNFKSQVWLDQKKSPQCKRESNSGSSISKANQAVLAGEWRKKEGEEEKQKEEDEKGDEGEQHKKEGEEEDKCSHPQRLRSKLFISK